MIDLDIETRPVVTREESGFLKDMFRWSDGVYRFTEEGSSNPAEHWMHFRLAKKDR